MSSVEAAAARALVHAGLQVHEVSAAGLVIEDKGHRAEVGLGSLRRVLALDGSSGRVEAWAAAVVAGLRGDLPEGDVRERLVPRLMGRADPRLWTTSLAPGLHLAVAEDLPHTQRLLTPFDLPRLGLAMADAHDAAVRNLRACTPAPDVEDGVHSWAIGDGLDAARLLLTGSQGHGALVVVPARDLCWWVPVLDSSAMERGVDLALQAQTLGDLPYALSPALWWVPAGDGAIEEVGVRKEGERVAVALPDGLAGLLG